MKKLLKALVILSNFVLVNMGVALANPGLGSTGG
jgi:hypothetical protein